jgi:hypothetical protein
MSFPHWPPVFDNKETSAPVCDGKMNPGTEESFYYRGSQSPVHASDSANMSDSSTSTEPADRASNAGSVCQDDVCSDKVGSDNDSTTLNVNRNGTDHDATRRGSPNLLLSDSTVDIGNSKGKVFDTEREIIARKQNRRQTDCSQHPKILGKREYKDTSSPSKLSSAKRRNLPDSI